MNTYEVLYPELEDGDMEAMTLESCLDDTPEINLCDVMEEPQDA